MAQNMDKRIILYPNYIDGNVTVAGGRVLSKEQACPSPDVTEMHESCKQLGVDAIIEDKHYPRAWWVRGRLRVALKDADGKPLHAEYPTKRALMVKIAEVIRNNPKRPPRMHAWSAAQMLSQMPGTSSKAAGSSAEPSSSKPSSGTSNKKKKGRK